MLKQSPKICLAILFSVAGFLNGFAQTPPPFVAKQGLVGWWPFNGAVNDESGNGNTGSTTGGASLTKDRFGNDNAAYSLPGLGGYLYVNNLSDSLNKYGLSVSVWCKLNDISQYAAQSLVARNNGPEDGHFMVAQSEVNGAIYGEMKSGTGNSISVGGGSLWPTHTVWHHVVYTYDSMDIRIFVDDSLTGNTRYSKPIGYSALSGTVYFGAQKPQGGSAALYVDGKLDDIGIWNRALTRKEIHQLYTQCNLEISGMPATDTVNVNNTAQFIVTSPTSGATYKWQVDMGLGYTDISNAGPFSGADNDTLIISGVNTSQNNTRYRCVLTSGACSDTTTAAYLYVSLATGTDNMPVRDEYRVYPNPTNNNIFIERGSVISGDNYFILTDMTGKVVLRDKINAGGQRVSLQDLSPGIYLHSTERAGSKVYKVVKE